MHIDKLHLNGQLEIPVDKGDEGVVTLQPQIFTHDEKNKPEGESGGVKPLSLSPTIKYAGSEQFAPSIE